MKKTVFITNLSIIIAGVGFISLFVHAMSQKPVEVTQQPTSNSQNTTTSTVQADGIRESKPQNGVYTITIKNGKVDQPNIDIQKGKTVRWVNSDTVTHTLVGIGDTDSPGPNSGPIEPGQSFSFTFNTNYGYKYEDPSYPSVNGVVGVYTSQYE